MILYHFTAARLIKRIKREGLTLGGVLDRDSAGRLIARTGYIWLTTNDNFYAQDWNSMLIIPYDRAEFRITVRVPTTYEGRVINWLEYCASGNIAPDIAEHLNAIGDPHNWRLYRGVIPPAWFKAVNRKLIVAAPLTLPH